MEPQYRPAVYSVECVIIEMEPIPGDSVVKYTAERLNGPS